MVQMAARVLYRDAQGRTGEVQLSADQPCYIGRALDCAVRTDDAMVSRKHSLIRMEGGRFLVEDLGSSNGTHVNDIKVSRQTLNHNDVVRCGNLWLRYIDDGPSEPAASPASKFQNTLGGDGPDLPASGPAVVDPTVAKPMGAPPAAPVMPMAGHGSGGQPATIMAGGDDGQLAGDPTPPAGGVMATMMSPGAMPQRANGGSQPHARAPSNPVATYETEPAGALSRDELERRLNLAVSRGAELERSLLTLQAELQAAQEKIKALLRSVQELTGLKQ